MDTHTIGKRLYKRSLKRDILKGGVPLYFDMLDLRELSTKLYNFHKDSKYNDLKSLCDEAGIFFSEVVRDLNFKSLSHTYISGRNVCCKKCILSQWLFDKIDTINGIIKEQSDNNLDAPKKLYDLLFRSDGTPKYPKAIKTIETATDFYRMRSAENYKRYNRKDIFVIPDNMQHIVGNYRFNPSGSPCLYLASNLYLAWEELRRPDFETVNFSRFRNTRKLHVLDLTIHNELKCLDHFLMAYFALLCSAKTSDGDKHHFQYVVPNLLMKVLLYSQKVAEENSKMVIDGIQYLSSRRFEQKDFLFNDRRLSTAFVFPKHSHDTDQEGCSSLDKLFKLTEPRTYFLYKTQRFSFSSSNTAHTSDYINSLFYKLEQQTMSDQLKKI